MCTSCITQLLFIHKHLNTECNLLLLPPEHSLNAHENIVDGDVDNLHEEPDKAHHHHAHARRRGDLLELYRRTTRDNERQTYGGLGCTESVRAKTGQPTSKQRV